MNNGIVELRDSSKEELKTFTEFESNQDTKDFIHPYSLEKHEEEFRKPDVIYKTIFFNDKIVGFIILKLEDDDKSIEFRRIVVNEKGNR